MKISRNKSRASNGKLRGVVSQLIKLESQNQYNSYKYKSLVQKRTFLEAQRDFKYKFYAANKHSANNDKCTSYFLSNSVFSNRPKINSIIDKDNNQHNVKAAEAAFSEHFKQFLQEPPTSGLADSNTIPNYLRNIPIGKIKKIEPYIDVLTEITERELDRIIKKSHHHSSPGLSGWSYQALKVFYPFLKPLLLKFLNTCDNKASLSAQLRSRKIVFLRKPGRDPNLLGSYTPICLLEISYKVLSSILSERLKRY